ncbi:MAG: hypothetical protein LBV00_10455 [Propionibacteriaceae bacterium]|jgi:hypothetical protein|nr:hypothetical protein [Propionibacteriaceae bacterium]
MTLPRQSTSLDGLWDLILPDSSHHLVTVPGPWTSQISGHEDSHETVTYRREFTWSDATPPEAVDGGGLAESADKVCLVGASEHVEGAERVFLCFAAVTHAARVRLNGVEIGRHTGAWLPFEFDVTAALVFGLNQLEVDVSYPPVWGGEDQPGFLEEPLGKQSWYGTTAGIWQSVRLERRPPACLGQVRVRANAAKGSFLVEATLDDPLGATKAPHGDWTVWALVHDHSAVLASAQLASDNETWSTELSLPEPHAWSVDDPHLYEVEFQLRTGSILVDAQTVRSGLRRFEARDGRFFLNDQEIYLRGVLDQDYHPGATCTVDDVDAWEAMLRRTKDLGFNLLRVHIKRPDPRYFDIADRLGLLVWAELPSWMTWTDHSAATGVELLSAQMEQDGHHPSIVIWSVMNESWGIDLTSAEQRAWLQAAYRRAKAQAPHCLVVDNSACEPNFHIESDIEDYHVYRGIPESRRQWDAMVTDLASRPSWTYSPHGDARRSGQEPLMVSEFGNWGLPDARDQYHRGSEPWWFASGADWAFGVAEGSGLMNRFESTGLRDVFGSWPALIEALQRAQMVANRYQTLSIRSRPQFAGYVLTQLCDVEWEANGLFDASRREKPSTRLYSLANGPDAVLLQPAAWSGFIDQCLDVDVTALLATASPSSPTAPVRIRVTLDGGAQWSQPVSRDDNGASHRVVIRLPHRPGEYRLAATLMADDTELALDEADIIVVENDHDQMASRVDDPSIDRIIASDEGVGAWLGSLGLSWSLASAPGTDANPSGGPRTDPTTPGSSPTHTTPEQSPTSATPTSSQTPAPDCEVGALLVTTQFTPAARAHACAGGQVLLLIEHSDAFDGAFDYLPSARLAARSGDGDWVPRTEWLDRRGAFSTVPGTPILGIGFEDVLGDLVITGIPGPLRAAHVHSGVFSGWLRGAATSTATVRWSRGHLTMTTFKLRACVDSALGQALGQAMIRAARAR